MFDEDTVRRELRGSRFSRLRYAVETDSTNDDAAHLLGRPSSGGTLIVAEYQRHGRGRRGRRWLAPAGTALLFTAILPDRLPATNLWIVPFWCALAVAEGVRAETHVALTLQWPNDLLVGNRKVCGILCTSRVVGGHAWAACGIGINVRRPAEQAALVEHEAAYLSDVAPGVAREAIFLAIVRTMDRRLSSLADPPAVVREWESGARVPGERYRVHVDGEASPFEGRALRLETDGSLILAVNGTQRRIGLADARVVRN